MRQCVFAGFVIISCTKRILVRVTVLTLKMKKTHGGRESRGEGEGEGERRKRGKGERRGGKGYHPEPKKRIS